jgi:hypothetical protein
VDVVTAIWKPPALPVAMDRRGRRAGRSFEAWFDQFWEPDGDYSTSPSIVYHCCWLRDGRLTRVEDHLTKENALHAIGV